MSVGGPTKKVLEDSKLKVYYYNDSYLTCSWKVTYS